MSTRNRARDTTWPRFSSILTMRGWARERWRPPRRIKPGGPNGFVIDDYADQPIKLVSISRSLTYGVDTDSYCRPDGIRNAGRVPRVYGRSG